MRRFAAFLKALRLSAAHVLRDVGPHVGRPIFDKGTQLDIGATLFHVPIPRCGGDTFAVSAECSCSSRSGSSWVSAALSGSLRFEVLIHPMAGKFRRADRKSTRLNSSHLGIS